MKAVKKKSFLPTTKLRSQREVVAKLGEVIRRMLIEGAAHRYDTALRMEHGIKAIFWVLNVNTVKAQQKWIDAVQYERY
jgi:hypothetical protein